MCMDKRNEFGEKFVYFSRMNRYQITDFRDCLKNLQLCELRYPMCIICIRRGTDNTIDANVRTLT